MTSSLPHSSPRWLKSSVNHCALNKTVKRFFNITYKDNLQTNKFNSGKDDVAIKNLKITAKE